MKFLKYFFFRRKIKFPEILPGPLKFKVAQTKEEYLAAARVLYSSYLEKGYTSENEHGLRLTPYHLLPSTTVILALWDNEVIGTVSLIRDNPLGLPLEQVFDVRGLRIRHQVLCEVSALAIKKEFRGASGEVFHSLVRYMWNYALHYFGVDYLVIAVNPSMYELYEAVYYFEPLERLSRVENYDFANNNPAVGEFIPLKTSFELFKQKYGDSPFRRNLYSFMNQVSQNHDQFPERKYFSHLDSPVTVSWVREMKTLIPKFDQEPHVRDGLAQAHGFRTYSEVQSGKLTQRPRVPVSFRVNNFDTSRVVDVSQGGLKLFVDPSVQFHRDTPVVLNCQVSMDENATVLAEPLWENKNGLVGLRVRDQSRAWEKMINTIVTTGPGEEGPTKNAA
jgi:hypothetical protein